MIASIIQLCLRNRAMVLLLSGMLMVVSVWAIFQIKLDAIPDLSDVQVILRTEYEGQAPQIVEDQVTYPLSTAMLSVPHAKVVRGYSMFGMSFVYVIFEDGTDLYWARSRVLEQLSFVASKLPPGISPQLGPDATGVGWVYQYALITGSYCPEHPNGLWHDPRTDRWYEKLDDAPQDREVRARLVKQRVFDETFTACPLTGKPLVKSDVDLMQLRSLQDWYLRYELAKVPGVSEVAPIGGFEKQYQITVDPVKLLAYNLPLRDVMMAIQRSNADVGGRVVEMSESEYVVSGQGYLGRLTPREIEEARAKGWSAERARTEKVLEELRLVSLGATGDGTPVLLGQIADIRLGPEMRRGALDWNGEGDAVGGIIVMRFGENARTTIHAVQAKLQELEKGLPPGVGVEVGYDRSDLIDRAVGTLSHTLIEEITVVALVCILFLLHARSELVAVCVVPAGVVISILAMHLLGINANVMSLGGIAIAIGVMVDSAIVMVENAHKHLDREEERLHALHALQQPAIPRPRIDIIREAAVEVGPSLFFSLLIITVSFLPVFVLGQQSGRLFKPLAFTKTFAMASAAVLSITLIPVLMSYFITSRVLPKEWGWLRNSAITLTAMFLPAYLLWRIVPMPGELEPYRTYIAIGWAILAGMLLVPQKIIHEDANPISRFLQWIYDPFFTLAMRFRFLVLLGAVAMMVSVIYPWNRIGSEFMPPLEEGDILYMPTTDPGISITKARELLQQTDRLLKQFPEVVSVYGKIGWAETATDPAPLNMYETVVMLQRDRTRWRQVPVTRFFDHWPAPLRKPLHWMWPETQRAITTHELVYGYELAGAGENGQDLHVPGMNEILQIPGLTNSWTMPIKTRIDMLSTGIKTPVGVKVMGPDLQTLGEIAAEVARALRTSELTGPFTTSAFAEKSTGGNYLDIRIDRQAIARHGLTISDVQDVIATAMGGMPVTRTVEGLERYTVNLRYPPELRDNLPALRQTLVPVPVPMSGGFGGESAMNRRPARSGMGGGGGAAQESESENPAALRQIPLGQLASFEIRKGPDMVKSENARRTSWVYVDIANLDVGTYVERAQRIVDQQVKLPPGYSIVWSGEYEYMLEARARLMVVIPLTLVLILMILYVATQSWLRVAIVFLALPFSLVGALWFVWWMDYHMSLAVWVGIIALAGLDAETGLVMLLYLDNSFERFKSQGRMRDANDLWHAIHDGAVKRIRPKAMTVAATFIGLVPLLWADGAGADTMRRLAVPMLGGLTTSFILELLIYPVLFYQAKRIALRRTFRQGIQTQAHSAVTA